VHSDGAQQSNERDLLAKEYSRMALPNRTDFRRLILLIERDLVTHTHMKALLVEADANLAGHRKELRGLRARMKRAGRQDK
jgi:hypothetical protein